MNLASVDENYPSCSWFTITGGSNSYSSAQTVTFPGGYSASDPGLSAAGSAIYSVKTNAEYTFPGPAPVIGSDGSSSGSSSASASGSASSVASSPAASSTASGVLVAATSVAASEAASASTEAETSTETASASTETSTSTSSSTSTSVDVDSCNTAWTACNEAWMTVNSNSTATPLRTLARPIMSAVWLVLLLFGRRYCDSGRSH
ncbi:hypothetical protein BT96DRAFT_637460 [Gymnopus androsaceus JB14]|uniref:lytic cellulose monooxygenase (C4-dehydrogenating) n=1 Tax=Gymnopus androsaceus JB14 TaxID=1447944 RepID=A0A6A4GGP4_9AGAR|nr:hypothetical protein BT96DRAFT_637460 [Gymnopus androsaceus JB14]